MNAVPCLFLSLSFLIFYALSFHLWNSSYLIFLFLVFSMVTFPFISIRSYEFDMFYKFHVTSIYTRKLNDDFMQMGEQFIFETVIEPWKFNIYLLRCRVTMAGLLQVFFLLNSQTLLLMFTTFVWTS